MMMSARAAPTAIRIFFQVFIEYGYRFVSRYRCNSDQTRPGAPRSHGSSYARTDRKVPEPLENGCPLAVIRLMMSERRVSASQTDYSLPAPLRGRSNPPAAHLQAMVLKGLEPDSRPGNLFLSGHFRLPRCIQPNRIVRLTSRAGVPLLCLPQVFEIVVFVRSAFWTGVPPSY